MKCPTCGSLQFYAKDPDDEYEEHHFSIRGDQVVPDAPDTDALSITNQTEAFCERCTWHGRLAELKQ